MTKIFTQDSLIPYKDGILVVDKETKPEYGEMFLSSTGVVMKTDKNYYASMVGRRIVDSDIKIIASTVHIEGIPFIELPIIDDYKFDKEFYNPIIAPIINKIKLKDYNLFLTIGGLLYDALLENYKLISEGYSEEDMRKAFRAGENYENQVQYLEASDEDSYIGSLKPKIKSIGLDYEEYVDAHDLKTESWTKTKLKIHDKTNNIIYPISIEYIS